MSVKNTFTSQILTSKSLTTSFSSSPTRIIYTDNISYQINVFTTNSTGTFTIEASDDYQFDPVANKALNTGNWNALPLGSSSGPNPVVNAANTVISVSLNQVPFEYIRITYTANTPGTGTCDAFITCKRLGG